MKMMTFGPTTPTIVRRKNRQIWSVPNIIIVIIVVVVIIITVIYITIITTIIIVVIIIIIVFRQLCSDRESCVRKWDQPGKVWEEKAKYRRR